MSEPKWTPAQRAAIEDRGGALLVSAAAAGTIFPAEYTCLLYTSPRPRDA